MGDDASRKERGQWQIKNTTSYQWLPYEMRRVGKAGLVLPVVVMLGVVGIAVAMALTGSGPDLVALRLTSGLEYYLPFVAGLAVAFVVSDEPALDLHLTLETRYPTTVLRRLALVVGWSVAVAILWASTLRVLGMFAWSGPFLVLQLGWLAPLLWYVSLGVLLSLQLRSRVASGAILAGVWLAATSLGGLLTNNDFLSLFSLSMTTYGLPFLGWETWLNNRIVLIAMSLAMALWSVRVLRNNETLVRGGDG